MSDLFIKTDGVSKKFCKSLKHSMLYGLQDITRNMFGRPNDGTNLRLNEFWAVNNVSFELKRGECLGLIGPNGSGKSTLLKMLNGIIMPDKGRIEIKGKVGALIEVGAGFHPMLSGRENIYVNGAILGLSKQKIISKFDEIVDFAEIEDFLDTPVKHYSSGMYVRLGFAIAAQMELDILLIDEVLAVGDEGFQTKCLNKIGELKKNGVAIVFVSHNMHTVSTFTNRVIVMENSTHREFSNVSEGINAYRKLFLNNLTPDTEKLCSGNDRIRFYDVDINTTKLRPGDSFCISLKYDTKIDYLDAEVDLAIWTSNELSFHFQATNKAYNQIIDLKKEKKIFKINIKDIRINNAIGIIGIAIWSNNRSELLFWWRIPVEFKGLDHVTGNTFLDVSYDVK